MTGTPTKGFGVDNKERVQRLRELLKYTREQWDGFQHFLERTPRLLLDDPPKELIKLVGDIGEPDDCRGRLVGDILGKLREVDDRLVKALALLGKKVDTLDERIAKRVARAKRAIARRRAKRAARA